MSSEVIGWLISAAALVLCLAIGHLVQWLTAVETAEPGPSTVPRVYGQCQVDGCRCPAEEVCVCWTYNAGRREGEAIEDRVYLLCRHHREQAQAKIDDAIEDMVCV
jgi:hypothetical protein